MIKDIWLLPKTIVGSSNSWTQRTLSLTAYLKTAISIVELGKIYRVTAVI
jgi:hypothetical protein